MGEKIFFRNVNSYWFEFRREINSVYKYKGDDI